MITGLEEDGDCNQKKKEKIVHDEFWAFREGLKAKGKVVNKVGCNQYNISVFR